MAQTGWIAPGSGSGVAGRHPLLGELGTIAMVPTLPTCQWFPNAG